MDKLVNPIAANLNWTCGSAKRTALMSGSSSIAYIGCVPGSSLTTEVTFFRVKSTTTSYPVSVTGSITLAKACRVMKWGGVASSRKAFNRRDFAGSFSVTVEK